MEFISDIKVMIDELSAILGKEETYIQGLSDHSERVQYLSTQLSDASAKVYNSLPTDIQEVLLRRDSHGNVPLSQVETERLLIDLVSDKMRLMKHVDPKMSVKFSPLSHFFGYEGRCAAPSNFDADYTYSLGRLAAALVCFGKTGYICAVQNLAATPEQWRAAGVPLTSMLQMETRKGLPTPVIGKALVRTDIEPFLSFAAERKRITDTCGKCHSKSFWEANIANADQMLKEADIHQNRIGR